MRACTLHANMKNEIIKKPAQQIISCDQQMAPEVRILYQMAHRSLPQIQMVTSLDQDAMIRLEVCFSQNPSRAQGRGLVAPSKSDLIDFCRFWWLFRWICGNYLSSIFEKNILEFGGRLIYPFSSPKFRKTESWMRLWHPTIVEYDYFGNGDNYKFLPRRSIDSKLVIND